MRTTWKYLTVAALLAALLAGCAAGTETTPPAEDPEATEPAADPATESGETADGETADGEEAETTPDIAVVEEMTVTLYLPNDTADGFVETEETVGGDAQAIVDALIAHGAVPEGTAVLDFSLDDNGTETTDGETVSYEAGDTLHIDLDVSAEFQTGLSGMGTSGETMMLGSLVNTLLTAYNADTITVTVAGAPLETGHNIYDEPLTFIEP